MILPKLELSVCSLSSTFPHECDFLYDIFCDMKTLCFINLPYFLFLMVSLSPSLHSLLFPCVVFFGFDVKFLLYKTYLIANVDKLSVLSPLR